jgi:hypothetical protein
VDSSGGMRLWKNLPVGSCVFVSIYPHITQSIYVELVVTERTLSTYRLASLAAGAGIKVAKHGNYGVSSISGSSNVMEKTRNQIQQ